MIEEMRSDNEVTEAINNRELAFEIEFTSKKYNRTSVSINIVASDNVEVDSKKKRKTSDVTRSIVLMGQLKLLMMIYHFK
nr:hypothetical protein CoNPh37_CDS0142 [Staphylococcus phage S-CoN_Ph37]